MESFATSASLPFPHFPNSPIHSPLSKPYFLNLHSNLLSTSPSHPLLLHSTSSSKFKLLSSPVSVQVPPEAVNVSAAAGEEEKFDWYSQWYPLIPVIDLDKKVPHAKKVLGIDVVVWWDRNENAWKVFDDMCPHRLAPLSEGRIDQWGRLQCVYHGWCFDGSGNCKLIPQAPPDGPPVQTSKRACVAAYPTVVHHDIVWFWPNSNPQYKHIFEKEKPPFIPELDDPSFTKVMGSRDVPYGYDVLIENLADPAHLPYAHYGLVPTPPLKGRFCFLRRHFINNMLSVPVCMVCELEATELKVRALFTEKRDREGGRPLELVVKKLGIEGFDAELGFGYSKFHAPCIISIQTNVASGTIKQPSTGLKTGLVFMCIPVSPGNSRLIWAFPRNFGIWVDKVLPRWMSHMATNLLLDSDLYLLHIEERKIREMGPKNWQKACFLPVKSDGLVVGFRRWFNKYANSEVDWRSKYTGDLPPTPPREQLMDRYWTHVVNCSSCSRAYKGLNAIEIVLKVLAVGLIATAAATNYQGAFSAVSRTRLAILGTVCYAASKWLAHFVYSNFRYHDYNHSLPEKVMLVVRIFGLGIAL